MAESKSKTQSRQSIHRPTGSKEVEGSWRDWKTTEHFREESASLGEYLKSCPVNSQLLRVYLKPVN